MWNIVHLYCLVCLFSNESVSDLENKVISCIRFPVPSRGPQHMVEPQKILGSFSLPFHHNGPRPHLGTETILSPAPQNPTALYTY